MSSDAELLKKWRSLPEEQKKLVLDFVEFLHFRNQSQNNDQVQLKTPEDLGWPPGFFEETYGCLADDPIQRYPQGEYEEREQLK